jgi:hypothetical protein
MINIRNNKVSTKVSSDKMLLRYIRLLLWLNGIAYIKPYVDMINKIISLRKNSGTKMTVLYLKGAKLLLDHYLAGRPTVHRGPIRIASNHGLPLIIPKSLRDLIRSDDLACIRVIQGTLSVFRILPLKGELSFSSITRSFTGLSTTLNSMKVSEV